MTATVISIVSLLISVITAWLTLIKPGTVKMTQPTLIYFGPDIPKTLSGVVHQKVFLRTLLFATSKRGRIIESMHVAVSRDGVCQMFNIWGYGNQNLVRGSGLFVPETGLEANHHFLVPRRDALSFHFSEGRYELQVFARLLNRKRQLCLLSQTLEVSHEASRFLGFPDAGIFFNWEPDTSRYIVHLERNTPSLDQYVG